MHKIHTIVGAIILDTEVWALLELTIPSVHEAISGARVTGIIHVRLGMPKLISLMFIYV